MRKIIFAIFLIYVCVFIVSAQSKISKEEYDVYAVVLKRIYQESLRDYNTELSFVVLDKTFKPDGIAFKDNQIKSLIKDFNRKNRFPAVVNKLIPLKYRYEVISQSEIDELLKIGKKEFDEFQEKSRYRGVEIVTYGGEVWKPFYQEYPDANGYYQLSRVGFNKNKTFALVCLEREAGLSNDTGHYLLKKVKGKWKIYQAIGWGGVA